MKIFSLIVSVFAITIIGCGTSPDDELVEPTAMKVEFKGTPDERFVATWKSTNGVSTYVFEKAGTYKLDSKIVVKGQSPINSHLEGEWRLDGDRMLFRDGSGNVVPYSYKLNGDTLELALTGKMKAKTVLKKQ